MEALSISTTGAASVTPDWCVARLAEGYQMLVVGLWTGNAANANAERALRYWREVGGRTAAYYSIYHAKPVPEHFGRARIAAGDEWAELNFVGIDCEINMINADMVLESANLVQGDGLRPVVSTHLSFWKEHMGNPLSCRDLPLWNANYPQDPHRAFAANLVSPKFGGWEECVGHQRQGTHQVDGVAAELNTFDDAWIETGTDGKIGRAHV